MNSEDKRGDEKRTTRSSPLTQTRVSGPSKKQSDEPIKSTDHTRRVISLSAEGGKSEAQTFEAKIDRYQDLGDLGSGGMGEVRRVFDTKLKRSLAMKLLHRSLSQNKELVARFMEECQVGAQLQHPSLVPIYDAGQLEDGRLYFTMQEVRGSTFAEAIREVHHASAGGSWKRSLSGWSLIRLIENFCQVGAAIAYAHQRGVIHRDLKPSNLMVGHFGEIFVVDWGLAKVLS